MFGIPEYELTRIDEVGDQLNVSATIRMAAEPCCSREDLVLNGGKVVLIRDVSVGGKMVGVRVRRQRYKCRRCGNTRYQPMPHVSDSHNMTCRMVERIEKESAARTFASVADELGISEASVRKIFNRYVDRRLGELGIETPRRMGLDEVYVGGKCRGLVTNLARKTIVNLMEDRKGSTVSAYLAGLPNRSNVEIVAMDFWDPYRQAVRANLPNATVVVDRFHVMAICIAALEKVRKAVRRSATRRQTSILANDRTLLLSNAEELDDEQMKSLARMFGHYPALAEAHKAKEAFRSIWECATPKEGAEQYDTWKRSLSPLVAPAFEEVVWHFDRWRNEILAFIDTGATNAYTESLNNAVRILTRIGRGYSFETLRARMLLNHSAPRPAARRYIRSSSLPLASGNEASQMSEASTPHFGIDLADVEVLVA